MIAPALDFTGQVALVTGGAAGIGLGIAQALRAAGARVAIGDLRERALGEAAARLGRDGTFASTLDVRDEGSVEGFVAGAERALGPITIAVANAGIYPNMPVLDMAVAEWDRVMETNARGVFLTCRAAGRAMAGRGAPGRIVTIASGAAFSGRPGSAHYCASKAAVVMFTRVLAIELASQRINVNCVAPGYVKVDSETSPLAQEFERALLRDVPWGRLGTPADIANAVLFLCSPLAEYMTGEVIAVNGGVFAGRAHLPLSAPKP
jgi:NAD(P)-dependent dehydrogenase (short-subunit alcohol dehydrogenase family)